MELPLLFAQKMKGLLGDEYEDFLSEYDRERTCGLRYNPLKMPREAFLEKMPFELHQIPWAEEGYYYEAVDRPGAHPYHEAGAYYIQEPSAMAAAAALAVSPGDRALDLCAAPGGKSTQLAGQMRGQGILVSNEIHPARAKILSRNIERMGIAGAVVTNETPERLASRFPGFFTHILVDAPCSGEGMFRKEEAAVREWSPENVEGCAARQQEILHQASLMLKPGGIMVYSTCTFSPEENEQTIAGFLSSHKEFAVMPWEPGTGFSPGRPEWAGKDSAPALAGTVRLWPHVMRMQGAPGEGHFVARLRKETGVEDRPKPGGGIGRAGREREPAPGSGLAEALCGWKAFAGEALVNPPEGKIRLFGSFLYLIPDPMPQIKGLRVLRPGLCLGEQKKNRFEPGHALALFLHPEDARLRYELSDTEARAYLRGEALESPYGRGWVLMTYGGCSLGFAKSAGGVLKNHYPKGLRRNLDAQPVND